MKRHSKILIAAITIVIFLNLLSSCNENNATTSPSNILSSNSLEITSNSSTPVSCSTSSSSISATVIEEIKYDKTIIENKAVIDLDGDGKKENIEVKHVQDNDYAIEIYINNEKMIDASDFKEIESDYEYIWQCRLLDFDRKDGKVDIACALDTGGEWATPEYVFTYYNGKVYRTENELDFAGIYNTDQNMLNIARDKDGDFLVNPQSSDKYAEFYCEPIKVERINEKLIVNKISKEFYYSPLKNSIINLKTDNSRENLLNYLPINIFEDVNSKTIIDRITESSIITYGDKFSKKGYLQVICNGKEGWLDLKDENVCQFIYVCIFW